MNTIYDVGIVGAGVAGAFATYKLAKEHKNIKTILFDLGRPPMKRRRQLEGWLGCLPNSDGKLYLHDIGEVSEIVGTRKSKSSFTWFNKVLSNVNDFHVTKDRQPNTAVLKKFKKIGYESHSNDFIQIYPKDIHLLSKFMAESIEQNKNVTLKFDDEIVEVTKQKSSFSVKTESGSVYQCKKLIIAVGRSGWRWAYKLYSSLGIIDNNDTARYGIRIEMNSNSMKDFNKSNLTFKKESVELGPLSWYGTVIPEDHLDMAVSAFRSNENRWKSDKVSFNLIGNRPFSNQGFQQTDRIGKLTFVITNDRIIKERVSHIVSGKSKISILKDEYGWLPEVLTELGTVMPELLTKAYYHAPTIVPMAPKINLGNNLESEVNGMFVAGESAGIHGILSAGLTGTIVASEIVK